MEKVGYINYHFLIRVVPVGRGQELMVDVSSHLPADLVTSFSGIPGPPLGKSSATASQSMPLTTVPPGLSEL